MADDVSLEILAAYLQAHPDSAIALNLKACNQFRLYDGKAAEAELSPLTKEACPLVLSPLYPLSCALYTTDVLPPLYPVAPLSAPHSLLPFTTL